MRLWPFRRKPKPIPPDWRYTEEERWTTVNEAEGYELQKREVLCIDFNTKQSAWFRVSKVMNPFNPRFPPTTRVVKTLHKDVT